MSRGVRQGRATRSDALLVFALLGGLTAWLVDVFASWALVPVACNAGASWLLHLVAAASAVVAAAALATSISAARNLTGDAEASAGDAEASRHRFMAGVGIGLNALALVVIAFMWILVVFLEPCQGNQEFPLWMF